MPQTFISYRHSCGTALLIFSITPIGKCTNSVITFCGVQSLCGPISIARIAPISFQTSIPHRSQQVRCTLQCPMSGHHCVCISYTPEGIKGSTEENPKRLFQLNQYLSHKPHLSFKPTWIFIPPATKLGGGGGILDSPCLSVCPSVCQLPFRVRPVASTVQDGFFPYLVQIINSMRGCVACDDLWPWPISSRSFGLDLENRVRSVKSTVLDGFFLYLAQMITIIRGCVACYVFSESGKFNFWQIFEIFRLWPWKKKPAVLDGFFPYLAQMITSVRGCVACNDLWPWPISSRSFGLGLENRVRSIASTVPDGFFPYLAQMITSMRRCVACDDLWPWPISSRSFNIDFENRVRSVTFSVLDRLFPYLPQIITAIRGCVAC